MLFVLRNIHPREAPKSRENAREVPLYLGDLKMLEGCHSLRHIWPDVDLARKEDGTVSNLLLIQWLMMVNLVVNDAK